MRPIIKAEIYQAEKKREKNKKGDEKTVVLKNLNLISIIMFSIFFNPQMSIKLCFHLNNSKLGH